MTLRLEGQDPAEVPPYMRPVEPEAQATVAAHDSWEVQVGRDGDTWWIRQRPRGSEHWHLWRRMDAPSGTLDA